MMRTVGFWVGAALPTILGAQSLDLSNGSWVRLQASTLTGIRHAQVAGTATDSLRLVLDVGGPPVAIAVRDVAWLEVNRGRPHGARNRVIGLFVGTVIGFAAAPVADQVCSTECAQADQYERRLPFAVGGALLGLFVGSVLSREQWEVVLDRRSTPPE